MAHKILRAAPRGLSLHGSGQACAQTQNRVTKLLNGLTKQTQPNQRSQQVTLQSNARLQLFRFSHLGQQPCSVSSLNHVQHPSAI